MALRGRMDIDLDEGRIDAIFADLDRCHCPGVAVGIAHHGRPIYRKAFGLANGELPVLLTTATRMRINSMTKQFTSFAYMLLCEEGRAELDAPISRYLPELHPIAHRVTARDLLGHVSGLRDVKDLCNQLSGTTRHISSSDMLAMYRDIDDVNFEPRTAWCYNNGGYLLLTAAIERIADLPFEEVMRERIFLPLGMYDTAVRRWDDDFSVNSATLHTATEYLWFEDVADRDRRSARFEKAYLNTASAGEGGMAASVDDILRWLAHWSTPGTGTTQAWQAMTSPQRLRNGSSTGYGLGLLIGEYRGIQTISHGGTGMGSNSQLVRVPEAGLDVVVILNRDDVNGVLLANRVLDACLPRLKAPVESGAKSEPVSGSYRSEKTGRFIQLFARGHQQIVSINGIDVPFEWDQDDSLVPSPVASIFKQRVILEGNQSSPSAIRFIDFGSEDVLPMAPQPPEKDTQELAGKYVSESTATEAFLSSSDGPLLRTEGKFGRAEFKLENLSEGVWRAKSTSTWPWGGLVTLSKASELLKLTTNRNWN